MNNFNYWRKSIQKALLSTLYANLFAWGVTALVYFREIPRWVFVVLGSELFLAVVFLFCLVVADRAE